jgi:hypothetical protein
MPSIYAKELRTKDTNVTYINLEIIYDNIPEHILLLIPDAVKLVGIDFIEYLSRSSIASIEVYMESGEC